MGDNTQLLDQIYELDHSFTKETINSNPAIEHLQRIVRQYNLLFPSSKSPNNHNTISDYVNVKTSFKIAFPPLTTLTNIHLIQCLLEQCNVDPDSYDIEYPLLYTTNDSNIASLLIKNKANLGLCESSGLAALHIVGSIEVLYELLESKADPNIKSNEYHEYKSPLHCVSDPEIATILLQYNAKVDSCDYNGKTPLFYANNCDIALLLLENKANIHHKTELNTSVLHHIESSDVINLLSQHNADIEARNDNDMTPLHMAYKDEAVLSLLELHADPNARNQWGSTILQLSQEPAQIELLLNAMADPNCANNMNITALFETTYSDIAHLLIQYGADVTITNRIGMSIFEVNKSMDAIDYLLHNCEQTIINALSTYKFNPNDFYSIIHRWCRKGSSRIVKQLLKLNADPNLLDTKMKSPLHYCCMRSRVSVVPILLEAKADPNCIDNNGNSPLKLATDIEIVTMLLESKADPWYRSSFKKKGKNVPLQPHHEKNKEIANIIMKYRSNDLE